MYLNTLSKEEYINGYAEVVKHSLLTDKSALNFNSLVKLDLFKDSKDIINNYSQIKNEIVESDKYESNINFLLIQNQFLDQSRHTLNQRVCQSKALLIQKHTKLQKLQDSLLLQ